jgi:hypothetical protein
MGRVSLSVNHLFVNDGANGRFKKICSKFIVCIDAQSVAPTWKPWLSLDFASSIETHFTYHMKKNGGVGKR